MGYLVREISVEEVYHAIKVEKVSLASLVYETLKKLIATVIIKHPYINLADLYVYVPYSIQKNIKDKL